MATGEYDAVMTQEEYDATYGASTPTDLGVIGPSNSTKDLQYDAVMTQAEYDSTYGGHSEARAILNDALKGGAGFLSFIDELNPVGVTKEGATALKVPHLLGLGPKSNEESFMNVFSRVAKDYGLMTEDKPQTQLGRFAGNVAENAATASPFGPAAMVASGLFGGTGGYLGETVGGQTGRAAGAFLGGVSPAGLSKLGVAKELGEALGPTVSQMPILRSIFGDAPVKAAVGRALTKSAENPVAVERALQKATSEIAPQTQLQSLKTTSEIAGDRGLMRAEDAVQNALPGAPFKGIAEERAAVREGSVLKDYDPNINAYDVSKGLEQSIVSSADNLKEAEKVAWNAIPKDTPLYTSMPELKSALKNSLDDITYSGALPIEGEAAGLLKRFSDATSEGAVSFDVIQQLRSRALEVSRATAAGTSAADRVAHKVAGTLEEHLRNIVDSNVDAGALPEEIADLWQAARGATKKKYTIFGAPKAGQQNAGTKGLEQVVLKDLSSDNVTLLKEGLNSPDKLASHLQAAAAGGIDIKPLYKQALKAELDGKPQTQWANIVDRKRTQWEMVFSPDEMANLDRNLADVQAELIKSRGAVTSGSATNPRGNVQRVLSSEKGLAAVNAGFQNATTLVLAGEGARRGWNKSETTGGGIANALLYGTAGAVLGKAFKGATTSASTKFDNILVEALKDPRKALSAIEAAKPSELGKAVKAATLQAGASTLLKGLGIFANSAANSVFKTKENNTNKVFESEKPKKEPAPMPDKEPPPSKPKYQEQALKLKNAVIGQESGGDIKAVSEENAYMKAHKTGTAKGIMQLLDSTGKEWHRKLGLKGEYDPFNKEQNETIGTAYLADLLKQFNGDEGLALTAYHSGENKVKSLLAKTEGSSLADILQVPFSEGGLGPVGRKYALQVLKRLPKTMEA